MKKLKTIFKYTYLWNVKTKSFMISTIIGVIILGLAVNVNVIKDKLMGNEDKNIAVCDMDGTFGITEDDLSDLGIEKCNYEVLESSDIEETKDKISDGKGDIDCLISLYSKDEEKIEVYSKSNSNSETIRSITSMLKSFYMSDRAVKANLNPVVLQNIMADVPVSLVESDEEKAGNSFLVYFIILLLYMVIMFYGMAVLNSVVEEKNNRIMETLITMASSKELFFGKVLGVCAVTFTQLVVLIASGAVFMSFNDDISSLIKEFNININAEIVAYLAVFVIFGYLIYAFIFAALGSLVSSTQDSSQAVMPITFLAMGIMMGGIISIPNPDSTFAVVMSYIPFSSPIFMFERAVLTDISIVNVIISIAILIVSIFVIGLISSRVYKKGVLHYGKKASFFKVLLNKN